jgi:hypothetical protein
MKTPDEVARSLETYGGKVVAVRNITGCSWQIAMTAVTRASPSALMTGPRDDDTPVTLTLVSLSEMSK